MRVTGEVGLGRYRERAACRLYRSPFACDCRMKLGIVTYHSRKPTLAAISVPKTDPRASAMMDTANEIVPAVRKEAVRRPSTLAP